MMKYTNLKYNQYPLRRFKSLLGLVLVLIFSISLSSCEKYFGNKTDLEFIEKPVFQARDVAYVPIQPILDGFVYPTDVLAGFDELIYIVDNGTEEIIALDQALTEQGRFSVPGVKKLAQDRSLELLAIGTTDTVDGLGQPYTLQCIYRINMQSGSSYGIRNAKITNKVIHPFYFRNTISSNDPTVEFNDIAILATNEYYVTRNGNSSNIVGPDQAVLLFSPQDVWITPVSITSGGATYNDFFKRPFAISSRVQPPQISVVNDRTFLVTSIDENAVLKINGIQVQEDENGIVYVPQESIVGDYTQADDFLQRPFRFKKPEGLTITGDGTNFIFIVDAETDSLHQFTSNGLEGIKPPPGSAETKYIKASFGGTGSAANQFNEPKAVAYLNKIVYVADAGNGRVLRFKLTLDFD